MSSVNKVILVGALGADPEVRSFQNGGKVCNLRLATSEKWKDKNSGDSKEKTEWHTIAVFSEGLVGVCERFLKKGSKVYIEGKLQTRKWQDQSGADRYSTEIVLQGFDAKLVMLDGPSSDRPAAGRQTGGGSVSNGDNAQSYGNGGPSRRAAFDDDLDDSVPNFGGDDDSGVPFISSNIAHERKAS